MENYSPEQLIKYRISIKFPGEDGEDDGGLKNEWLTILS